MLYIKRRDLFPLAVEKAVEIQNYTFDLLI